MQGNQKERKDGFLDYSIILSVNKCSWGKCVFCGWGKLNFGEKTIEELKEQFFKQYKKALKLYEEKKEPLRLKFYVSGSFFDSQVPKEFFDWLVDFLKKENKKVKAVLFEAKIIDLLNKERVEKFVELNNFGIETFVGVGLEVTDNELLRKLKKDFQSIEQFEKIIKLIKEKYLIKFRTYLLVNPPVFDNYYLDKKTDLNYFETWTYNKNKELIEKNVELLKKGFKFTKNLVEEVVVINAYPHKNAEIFDYFYNKDWRPLTKEEFEEIIKRIFGSYFDKLKVENTTYETDFSNYSFVPQFPEEIKKEYKERKIIIGAKIENLVNRVYEIWEEYLLYFFEPKKEKDILFLIPCAAKKPYYFSKTHRLLKRTTAGFQIFKRMHWVVVSNPGVIPYEFVDKFPFKHYDWPEWEETEEIKEFYYKITKERVKRFLEKHHENYKKIIIFFKPDSLTYKAVIEAIEELNLKDKLVEGINKELYKELKEKTKRPLFSKELLD
ncbi:MAG: DUF5591 domain-containing protein, partial [Nanoarchaeota archaeon]